MTVKIYENKYGDRVINVGYQYLIYDKIDRLEKSCIDYTASDMKQYITNGFIEINLKIDCTYCNNSYIYGDKMMCKVKKEELLSAPKICNSYDISEFEELTFNRELK